MDLTDAFLSDAASYETLFSAYRDLLVSAAPEDKALFDEIVRSRGAKLAKKLFEFPLLSQFPERELQTTFCIFVSQACKALEFEFLEPIFAGSIAFACCETVAPQAQRLYASTFQSVARVCSLKSLSLPDFGIEKLVNLLLESFEHFQNSNQIRFSTPSILEILATFLVFDEYKIKFVNLNGLLIFSQFLAQTENSEVCSGILGLIHSLIFNLNDVGKQSIYDIISPFFAPIQLKNLIFAVLEKQFSDQKNVNFNVLMVLHGCLIPQTKDIACLEFVKFAAENFEETEIQIQIVSEIIIKFVAISPESVQISSFLAENGAFMQKIFRFLDLNQANPINSTIAQMLQVVAVSSPVNKSYIQFDFPLLPLLKVAHFFASQLINQSMSSAVQNLENCYVALTYFTETRAFAQWPNLAIQPEALAVLQLAESLSGVEGLLGELPGMSALLARLCATKTYISQAKIALKERFPVFYAFLVDFALQIMKQGKPSNHIVLSILKGLTAVSGEIGAVEPAKIVQFMTLFDAETDEEFADVLADLIEGYAGCVPGAVQAELEKVLTRMV
ncbi:hypothetical protein SS50377_22710 [Spironucleus salmonicida]|uniref:Uncharacterized protein n=1 Tax=Spironucleus salmonicida TaxID=348837 RepID=V6LI26_9EUKA|nr:hypothetical protein SS50377_22710 [Spironucleus salmonicida]|eukprot:EST44187.1 hypothetical protein SS50377_15993 [Spironucleus salmonicida]